MGRWSMRILVGLTLVGFSPSSLAGESFPVTGVKFPNDESEGRQPVVTEAWALDTKTRNYPGFGELVPFVLRSPHQQEAGSCLYMSLTGAAEFWLSVLQTDQSRLPDGPLDLSERFTMNLTGTKSNLAGVKNWKTDSIYLFNNFGASVLNTSYRFTKGWVKKSPAGRYIRANPQEPGAQYGTRYNWINESESLDYTSLVPLPKFEREVLFADPDSNQWNVAVMPHDIVDKIKSALLTRRAPVHVIYNHYGYWHAVLIVGFDDQADSKDCNFTVKFIDHMTKKGGNSRRLAEKVQTAMTQGGGCQRKGMLYVRDSIYADPSGPLYDYDLTANGDEFPFSRSIVLHEYDWVRYMANHVSQIYLQ